MPDVLNVNEAVQELNSQFLFKVFLSCDKPNLASNEKETLQKIQGRLSVIIPLSGLRHFYRPQTKFGAR